LSAIYSNKWDNLKIDDISILFHCKVSIQFGKSLITIKNNNKAKETLMPKSIEFSDLPPPLVPSRPSKEELNKLKYYSRKQSSQGRLDRKNIYTYMQASARNIKDILKLKENFSNLLAKKIENVHNTINKTDKPKPCINMTTKGLPYKQIIIPISSDNINKFIVSSSEHVAGPNYILKSIKSDNIIDFI